MDREHEGGKPGGENQVRLPSVTWIGQTQPQNPKGHEVKEDRIRGVQEEIGHTQDMRQVFLFDSEETVLDKTFVSFGLGLLAQVLQRWARW